MAKFVKDIQDKINKYRAEPGRVFGLLYPYILVIGLGLGLYYVSNLNEITRRKVEPKLVDSTAIDQELKVVEARTIPPLNIMAVKDPTPELMEKGANLYTTICASCHGADGNGSGPAAAGMNPPPRNLTTTDNWKNGATIQGIFQTLTEGIPGTAMIPYDYLTPEERVALAHHIRGEYTPNPPASTDGDLQAMDATFNLSAGSEVAAQIPVAAAKAIIERETSEAMTQLVSKLHRISGEENIEGGRIFNRVTNNKILVIYALSNSQEWRENRSAFIRFVMRNSGRTMFNRSINNLDETEWEELYNLMLKTI
jgi:mono/diheme cytochrome c family protein